MAGTLICAHLTGRELLGTRGKLTTAVIVLTAALTAAGAAWAEETAPTREQYVAQVDPICKSETDANKPLLKTAKRLSNSKKYKPAALKI